LAKTLILFPFFLGAVLRKYLRKILNPEPPQVERASEHDYELLHTLCTVWSEGPMAQAYMESGNRVLAPAAAKEVRLAIEGSLYVNFEIGQDHIQLLRRLEALDPNQQLQELPE